MRIVLETVVTSAATDGTWSQVYGTPVRFLHIISTLYFIRFDITIS